MSKKSHKLSFEYEITENGPNSYDITHSIEIDNEGVIGGTAHLFSLIEALEDARWHSDRGVTLLTRCFNDI